MTNPPYPSEPGAAPGFPRYGPHPSAGAYLPPPPQPVHGLMIGSIVVAALFTALEVIDAALAWPAQAEYLDAADRGVKSYDVWTAYDFTSLLFLPAGIAAYVVTCLWLYRARTNAEALFPPGRHARGRGWVWGGWICPIVSLWFPYQIVRDVARDPRAHRSNALIGWWWAMWLISMLFLQIGSGLVGFEEIDKGAVSALGTVETINAVITVVTFVLWIGIVRRVSRMQDELMGITR